MEEAETEKQSALQEMFGKRPQAHGVSLVVSCAGPGVGLDPWESLPTGWDPTCGSAGFPGARDTEHGNVRLRTEKLD